MTTAAVAIDAMRKAKATTVRQRGPVGSKSVSSYTIEIPQDTVRALRALAAMRGVYVKDLIVTAVTHEVRKAIKDGELNFKND
jgi:hypothetical protein